MHRAASGPGRATLIWAVLAAGTATGPAAGDWPQWGGSSHRNNASPVAGLPKTWDVGTFDRKTGVWNRDGRNIKWVARLGSQTYGTPVVADGRVYVGTNNASGYLKRYPAEIDLGCLLCFRESDGELLWQFSAEKLPTGRVHDWPLQGIASSPLVEGDRAWFVSNRGEVVCVDTQGFYDDEDDGPLVGEAICLLDWRHDPKPPPPSFVPTLDGGRLPDELVQRLAAVGEPVDALTPVKVLFPGKSWSCRSGLGENAAELDIQGTIVADALRRIRIERKVTVRDRLEADVVWRFDMMKELGSSQHNLATCCVTTWGNTLFVCTGNGVDESHNRMPAPQAPSFVALDKRTGTVLWTSNLPGANVHHGQWSAPAVGMLGGVPQVVFCGGDGWVYSFHAEERKGSSPRLLWKFDTNPKDAVLSLGGRGTRHEPIAPPVLYDDKVFVTVGQDPEHGEGPGRVWCIDATRKLDGSDVSEVLHLDGDGKIIPHQRDRPPRKWRETLLSGAAVAELDQEYAGEGVFKWLSGLSPPLPAGLSVRRVVPGETWELNVATDRGQETWQAWKRRQVDRHGDLTESYIAALPTHERVVKNPNSAAVWKYDRQDRNGNGEIEFEEEMHRSICSVVIHDALLFCVDYSGVVHCLDRQTGQVHWTSDRLSACWGTPLIADGRLFVPDEDGRIAMFNLAADPIEAGLKRRIAENGDVTYSPLVEIDMGQACYTNPVAANGFLYIATKMHLFALEQPRKME
jgi:outer membrane protein assembly factor BamB